MTTTIPASKTDAGRPARHGFPAVPCILCGDTDGNVAATLDDLGEFHCNQCGEDFDIEAVRDQLAKWAAVLTWIDTAPAIPQ